MSHVHYGADYLDDLPTLAVGQTCNLKMDDGHERVWLCRCGVADGMPYDHAVTVERLIDGRWKEVDQYPGGDQCETG